MLLIVTARDGSGHLTGPMPRNHLNWCYRVYDPTLNRATAAYKDSPGSCNEILQGFEQTLRNAWRMKDFPDMEIPLESVKELRAAIIEGLEKLREALTADENKALVPNQPHPCTATLVSASGSFYWKYFCSLPLIPILRSSANVAGPFGA